MKNTRVAAVILAATLLLMGTAAQSAIQTYSIVDYPAYQTDTKTGLTDHVSGTIIADWATGVISSASFSITGTTTYTVASASFAPYYIHISPTQITVSSTGNSSPYGYGDLRLTGTPTGSPAFEIATLEWYVPSDPWVDGNNTIAAYTGVVCNNTGKDRGAEFATSVTLYPPQHPSGDYPTWVVAVAVPEPSSLIALAAGLVSLVGLRRRRG